MQNYNFEALKISDLPLCYDLEKIVAFNALSESEVLLLFAKKEFEFLSPTILSCGFKIKSSGF